MRTSLIILFGWLLVSVVLALTLAALAHLMKPARRAPPQAASAPAGVDRPPRPVGPAWSRRTANAPTERLRSR